MDNKTTTPNTELIPSDGASGLVAISDPGGAAVVAVAMKKLEMAIFAAKRFPRNVDECWDGLMRECARRAMADKAVYSYPRGGTTITGPSVYLARAAARNWGNMRFGFTITLVTNEEIHLTGWAHDLERTTEVEVSDVIKKLVQRKEKQADGTRVTKWVKPDERDLRELINKRGAIATRNAILQLIPSDMIDNAIIQANRTCTEKIEDPAKEKKRLILVFSKMHVTLKMLQAHMDIASDEWTATELVKLNNILNAIEGGQAKVGDYFKGRPMKQEPQKGTLSADDMKPGDPDKHQGHNRKPETGATAKAKPKAKRETAKKKTAKKTTAKKAAPPKEPPKDTPPPPAKVDEICRCEKPNDPQESGNCQDCFLPMRQGKLL